ncbi:MAG: hypothetical protein K2W96_05405, partial [Gemmataceae bacterium]|nr:hypothetical protein [Gemmataceae bacterium]
GVPRREAARRLGIGDGTLSHRLGQAREALARRLSSRGVALSAAALASLIASHAQATVPAALAASVPASASTHAVALSSILVKSMLASKLSFAAVLLAGAVLAFDGWSAVARPPAPDPDAKPDAPAKKAAAAMVKSHLEGRLWAIEKVDDKKRTLDLGEALPGGFQVIAFNPAGGVRVPLPAGAVAGLPVDEKAEVTVDGKPGKLSDLAKGMTVSLETVPGKARVKRIAAYAAPKAEAWAVDGIDLKKKTVSLSLAGRKVSLKDVPLSKALEVVGLKAPMVNGGGVVGGGVFAIGGEKVAARPDDVKEGGKAAVEFGFEDGQLVVRKLSIVMK